MFGVYLASPTGLICSTFPPLASKAMFALRGALLLEMISTPAAGRRAPARIVAPHKAMDRRSRAWDEPVWLQGFIWVDGIIQKTVPAAMRRIGSFLKVGKCPAPSHHAA